MCDVIAGFNKTVKFGIASHYKSFGGVLHKLYYIWPGKMKLLKLSPKEWVKKKQLHTLTNVLVSVSILLKQYLLYTFIGIVFIFSWAIF